MSKKARSFEQIQTDIARGKNINNSQQKKIPQWPQELTQSQKQEILWYVISISDKIAQLIDTIPEEMWEIYTNYHWINRHSESTSKKIRDAKSKAASSIARLYDMVIQYNIGSNDFQTQVGKLSKQLWETIATTITRQEVRSFREKLLLHIQEPIIAACK